MLLACNLLWIKQGTIEGLKGLSRYIGSNLNVMQIESNLYMGW